MGDLRALADDVWIDERLAGGQTWWNVILEKIATADLFVVALSRASVISEACLSEAAYAQQLERPFLAVRIDNVDDRAAPAWIRQRQILEYHPDDRASLRELARGDQHSACATVAGDPSRPAARPAELP